MHLLTAGGEQNARFPREAQSLSPEWTASEEPGREGLWWSCGAWSIMGRFVPWWT